MTRTRPRGGFTLVELIVVMSLAIVLAGLAVAVSESGAFGSQKTVSAADRASSWLIIAKQRALRDGKPRGVRFLFADDPTRPLLTSPNDYRNFSYVAREAQYIELPDAWAPNPTSDPAGPRLILNVQASGTPPRRAFFVTNRTTTAANQADVDEFTARVQADDSLVFNGTSYRIAQITTPSGSPAVHAGPPAPNPASLDYPDSGTGRQVRELILAVFPDLGAANSNFATPPATEATLTTTNFGFQAQARPLVGEPLLQLTATTVVDVRAKSWVAPFGTTSPQFTFSNQNQTNSPPTAAWPTTSLGMRLLPVETMIPTGLPPGNPTPGTVPQYFDVLFAPSGQVLNTQDAVVVLWLRDPDKTPHPRLDDPALFATSPGADTGKSFDAAGEQVLVTVYARTGLIATHPVSKGSDPYAAAKDGLNSGL